MSEPKTIGIVGGGQLGRMLTLAAKPLGFHVVVVDPNVHSPAAQVGAEEITADLYNRAALQELAKRSDYLTVEIEHLDTKALEVITAAGKPINPSLETIRLIQDKLLQKEFLKKAGVPVADFIEISGRETAEKAFKKFNGNMLIKTRYGAYDGRGNRVVKNYDDITKALKAFAGQKLYAEAYVPFAKELAVMIARDIKGNVKTYPVVETIHQRNICVEVLAPAPVSQAIKKQAEAVAVKVATLLDGAGVFGIELFLTKNNKILVNEIAPRVHNSGHYTIEASRTSQFEQHIRAVTGLPLGNTDMIVPAAVMINILGERNGETEISGLDTVLTMPNTSIHLYGKSPTKIDRKMGHITVTGASLAASRKRARNARKKVSV